MKNLTEEEKDIKTFNSEMEKHVKGNVKSYWIGDFAFDLFRERNDFKRKIKESKKALKKFMEWSDVDEIDSNSMNCRYKCRYCGKEYNCYPPEKSQCDDLNCPINLLRSAHGRTQK